MVDGQAMHQRRTGYARGGQVQQRRTIFQAAESPPEAEDVHLRRTEVCGGPSFFAALSREFYKVVGQAMRQRRTGYVPTQSGRTRFRPRRSHRLVLSANIGMILRTQTPAHTDSFGQQRQKFYLVVGQPPNNGIEYHKTGCNW